MRKTAAIALLAVAAGCMGELNLLGDSFGEAIGGALATSMRIQEGEPADLVCELGDPGYFPSLPIVGPQLHYYTEKLDQTWIAGDVAIGDELFPEAVACYPGKPAPETRGAALVRWEPSASPIVVVRVVDAGGRARNRVGVSYRYRMTGRSGTGTSWTDHGETSILVAPTGVTIQAPGCRSGWIELEPGEKAWCTLGPDGLRVDERLTRWQNLTRAWFP